MGRECPPGHHRLHPGAMKWGHPVLRCSTMRSSRAWASAERPVRSTLARRFAPEPSDRVAERVAAPHCRTSPSRQPASRPRSMVGFLAAAVSPVSQPSRVWRLFRVWRLVSGARRFAGRRFSVWRSLRVSRPFVVAGLHSAWLRARSWLPTVPGSVQRMSTAPAPARWGKAARTVSACSPPRSPRPERSCPAERALRSARAGRKRESASRRRCPQ